MKLYSIFTLLSSAALTLAYYEYRPPSPLPPPCAVACGAAQCTDYEFNNFGNLKCCSCFELARLTQKPSKGQNETELYSYCVKSSCPKAEYDYFLYALEVATSYDSLDDCDSRGYDCKVYDYSKTWRENELIRIELAKMLDLKIGLGIVIPLLAIIAAWHPVYKHWWKPRKERKAALKKQKDAEAEVELEQLFDG